MGNAYCCRKLPSPDEERNKEIESAKKGVNEAEAVKVRSRGRETNEMSPMQYTPGIDMHLKQCTSPNITAQDGIEDLTASIVKVQKCVRGKQTRKAFNDSIKPSLYQSQMEVINRQSVIYSDFKEAEAKATTKPYDKEGWKEFYPPQTEFFNYSYGDITEKLVMVVPPSKGSDTKEVSYYTGQVNSKNERHGFGVLSNSQRKMEGFWRRNAFTGWGRETTLNGNILEGKFIDGKLCGKGRLMNSKGETFNGDFENGKKKGNGKESTQLFIYEGEYSNNAMNGKGTITFLEEKNKYTGDFLNNELTGKGSYLWESGERYEGTLLKGNYHGTGIFTWPDGQTYEGEYNNGIKEGKGKMTYPNGNVYEGPYVNGNPHGIGQYTKKGKTVTVEFANGAFIKILPMS